VRILKRIFLFLAVNFAIIMTLTAICNIFNINPYLNGYGLNVSHLAIFSLILGFTGSFISLLISKKAAKWMMNVAVINRDQPSNSDQQLLLEIIEQLSHEAKIPMPEVGIYQSHEVNAFATGPSKRNSLVAVSQGLLNRMNRNEITGVLAHEIAHIANGDMVTMTLLQGIVNAFVIFLARFFAFVVSNFLRGNRRSHSPFVYILFVYLFQITFMLLGSMVIAAYSRYREYQADRGGARLSSNEMMLSALKSLKDKANIHDPKLENSAIQPFKIQNQRNNWISLFSTHPPITNRIARLQENTVIETT